MSEGDGVGPIQERPPRRHGPEGSLLPMDLDKARDAATQSGKKLKYAVAMKPICLAPTTGRFQRALPESTLGRVTNFVLFNLVEPIWPGAEETTREAAGPLHTAANE